jgi:DNA ligase 1
LRDFAALYGALDATTSTNEKIAAMVRYFEEAPAADAVWAVYFLSGRRPKRLISAQLLRLWAAQLVGIPLWLLEESYGAVGDSAEAAVLLLPPATTASERSLRYWVEERILPLRELDEEGQRQAILKAWAELSDDERFVFSKLITGAFRVGVSQRLLTRAVAAYSGVASAVIAHRLMGHWDPTPDFFTALVTPDTADADTSRPYPFFLAYPLEEDPGTLGMIDGMAGGMEVGWHSCPAHPASRRDLSLVARRGARHPALSGDSRRRGDAARRNRIGRRNPGLA